MGGTESDRVVPQDGIVMPHAVLLLLAAIAAAVVAQGGYYLPGRLFSGALAAAALVLALRDRPSRPGPLPVACAGLAAWAVLRALLNGQVIDALPTVAAVGCLAAAAFAAGRADARQRELCASALVGVGVLVALSGWAAVVWRIPSWSVIADGLTRAASTLTYPNAAAALLAASAVLALALHTAHPHSVVSACSAYALVVGVGATLSRAGLLALLAGLVALAVFNGVRTTLRHTGPPALGALIALAALAPSFPVAEPANAGLAVLGLVAGAAVTAGLDRARPTLRLVGVTAGFVAAVLVALLVLDLDRLLAGRLSTGSPDRGGATGAALDLVAARPWTGVGPGNGWFAFTGPDGGSRVMRYVHDEYLQVLVELGAIGLGLVVLVLVALAVVVRRGRAGALWAGCAAALVALLVHSGFDFLWHLPVIVLTAGLLTGLASAEPTARAPVRAATPTAEEKP
ncbi:O-antigen ligase-like membrane protein [Saccharothrix saharensis]|uniref:O-antigen ligase-like membrane protein n=1 Tax=Saccharothrix saharensis TaxID=571190 RepID=A0A543JJF6_9PSEU|nr:O-antigen ligase family protein [Saccharothrix saharensis]TQM82878.1 O-antigen ligase-like membrane protein [Saccharothrix saharensis]